MKVRFDVAFYPHRKMPVTTGIYMFKFKHPEVPPIQSFCSRGYNPTCRGPITPCITSNGSPLDLLQSLQRSPLPGPSLTHPWKSLTLASFTPMKIYTKGPNLKESIQRLPVSSWGWKIGLLTGKVHGSCPWLFAVSVCSPALLGSKWRHSAICKREESKSSEDTWQLRNLTKESWMWKIQQSRMMIMKCVCWISFWVVPPPSNSGKW